MSWDEALGTIAGWWQGCEALDLPPSDPAMSGVNLNLALRQTPRDPISGSSRCASLCDLAPA